MTDLAPPHIPAALALGASMGPRLANLTLAVRALDARVDISVVRCSRVYATPASGGVANAGFLNAVIHVHTTLAPLDLLAVCKEIETRLGRRPTRSWADRVLDLDVILYDRRVITTPTLRIPHPRLAERDFVLLPLFEAWPAAPNPWTGLPWSRSLLSSRRYPVVGVLPAVAQAPGTVYASPPPGAST